MLIGASRQNTPNRVSFRKLFKGGATGGIRILRKGGGGGMMVKDVTKFYKCHLGGQGVLECVCVCEGFLQDFKYNN